MHSLYEYETGLKYKNGQVSVNNLYPNTIMLADQKGKKTADLAVPIVQTKYAAN